MASLVADYSDSEEEESTKPTHPVEDESDSDSDDSDDEPAPAPAAKPPAVSRLLPSADEMLSGDASVPEYLRRPGAAAAAAEPNYDDDDALPQARRAAAAAKPRGRGDDAVAPAQAARELLDSMQQPALSEWEMQGRRGDAARRANLPKSVQNMHAQAADARRDREDELRSRAARNVKRPAPGEGRPGAGAGERVNAKDRVKHQRLNGQAGVGEDFRVWRSEEEMRQRQQFD